VSDRVDVLASIPLAGGVESLNASVAAALAVYETARVRGWVT
jgi:23S rRNA (guanosine2251-2'-O)-methyltransferase